MLDAILDGLDSFDPVNATPEPYFGGRLLPPLVEGQEYTPEWDIDLAYDEALDKSAMVDRCSYGLAEKGASVPLRVWERTSGSTKGQIVPDHDLDVVLNQPSADPVRGTRDELVTRSVLHHLLAGTSLTGIERGVDVLTDRRGATRVVGLIAEDPRQVFPIPSEEFRVAQWNYRTGTGQTRAWSRDDLVPWRRHNPANSLWGRSVIQSLALTVDSAVQGAQTHLLRIARDGRPGMILHSAKIKDRTDAEDKERRLNARQRTQRGGIMLLGADETLIANGMSETDLGLLKTMAFDRDMIAVAFGYLTAGFSGDAATYSNAGIFVLHEWGLVQQVMARWTANLTAFLFTREEQRRFHIAPDYSGVQALQEVEIEKIEKLTNATNNGVTTNDLIRAFDLPLPMQAGGDEVLVPKRLQPIAKALAGEG